MVVRSLFNQCIDSIQDHMRTGTLVNLDHLPTDVRQLIFLKFPSYNSTKYYGTVDELPSSLRRNEFFNYFEHLGTIDFSDCDQQKTLVSIILAEVERPGSSLVSTLVSLRLRVCFVVSRLRTTSLQAFGVLQKPTVELDIYRLIAACRNVRRLFLKRCSNCLIDPDLPLTEHEDTTTIDYGRDLDMIMNALETGGAGRAPLEELTLCNFFDYEFGNRYSALESLRALHIHRCFLSPGELWRLIEPCRKTLQTLNVEDTQVHGDGDDQSDGLLDLFWYYGPKTSDANTGCFPEKSEMVDLPSLTSLTVNESHWYSTCRKSDFYKIQQCSLSFETLRRLRHGKISVYDTFGDDTMKMLADRLPKEVEVAFVFGDGVDFRRLSFAHELFDQRIVELRFELTHARFPPLQKYDELIDRLTSIRVLAMGGLYDHGDRCLGDQFLRRFLSDPSRGAGLERLKIRWDLQPETLQLLFRRCVNLKWLGVGPHSDRRDQLPTITDEHLKLWAANGAKPKQIVFDYEMNFTAAGVESLLRNCDGDLKAPFLDKRGRFMRNF